MGGVEGDTDALADHDQGGYHENVFWTNSHGYLRNDDYSPKGINPDEHFPKNIGQYRFTQIYHNVYATYAILHPAGFTGDEYSLLMHNCQVYSDTVRRGLGLPSWHG